MDIRLRQTLASALRIKFDIKHTPKHELLDIIEIANINGLKDLATEMVSDLS